MVTIEQAMTVTIEHAEALVRVVDLEFGARRVEVALRDPRKFSPRLQWVTRYPTELVRAILEAKSPAWLCDEIARDEDPAYLQADLAVDLLSYVRHDTIDGCRIVDYGCGSGATTLVLARMFPDAHVTGVDEDPRLIAIANRRAAWYGRRNARFLLAPSRGVLPEPLGPADHVILAGVYEHLLPAERPILLHRLWDCLLPGGVLFLNQTPDRRFPFEPHTTWLPLINYLPARIARACAVRLSRRVPRDASWEMLLRMGIRGATPREILRILGEAGGMPPVLLRPVAHGLRRRSLLWFRAARQRRAARPGAPRGLAALLKACGRIGVPAPYLALAIRKPRMGID